MLSKLCKAWWVLVVGALLCGAGPVAAAPGDAIGAIMWAISTECPSGACQIVVSNGGTSAQTYYPSVCGGLCNTPLSDSDCANFQSYGYAFGCGGYAGYSNDLSQLSFVEGMQATVAAFTGMAPSGGGASSGPYAAAFAAVVSAVSAKISPLIPAIISIATMVMAVLVALAGVYFILSIIRGEVLKNDQMMSAEEKIRHRRQRKANEGYVREHNEGERARYETNDWQGEGFEDTGADAFAFEGPSAAQRDAGDDYEGYDQDAREADDWREARKEREDRGGGW